MSETTDMTAAEAIGVLEGLLADECIVPRSDEGIALASRAIQTVLDTLRAVEWEKAIAERHLGNLLARIHRDGGHYMEAVGVDRAVQDAESAVVRLQDVEAQRDHLAAELAAERERLWNVATEEAETRDAFLETRAMYVTECERGRALAAEHARVRAENERFRNDHREIDWLRRIKVAAVAYCNASALDSAKFYERLRKALTPREHGTGAG